MREITDEQRKLVEENHNLIYSFLQKNQFTIDEYYDVAAIGLCKAAMNFDSKKGYSFTTYAYKVMFSEVLIDKRKKRKVSSIPEHQLVYYYTEMENNNGDSCLYLNYIPAKEDVENDAILMTTFKKFLKSLPSKDKQIILLLSNGYKQREVAKLLGYSQEHISRIKSKLADKWKMQTLK